MKKSYLFFFFLCLLTMVLVLVACSRTGRPRADSPSPQVQDEPAILDRSAATETDQTTLPIRAMIEAFGIKTGEDSEPQDAITDEFYEADRQDMETLSAALGQLFVAMDDNNYYRYDCLGDDALQKAVNMTLGYIYPHVYAGYFGESSFKQIWESDTPDPLNKFDASAAYYCLPAENVQWILQHIFNVQATNTTFKNMHYYHDGNYYVLAAPTEIGSRTVKNIQYTKNADGTYNITADSYYYELGEPRPTYLASYQVVAGLKKSGGRKYWSFHSSIDINNPTTTEPESPDIHVYISEEEALRIAKAYWNISYETDVLLMPETVIKNNREYYRVNLKVLVDGNHYSTIDFIFINKETGEVELL